MKAIFKKIIVTLLTLEARLVLAKYKPKIIGITGSVGKTSTKDALFQVLAKNHYVRKSEKSYNSEIGIPLTILGVDTAWGSAFGWFKNLIEGLLLIILPNHYPEWLVLEIGADTPGDIRRTVQWVPLTVAVITRIGELPVHVEAFKSVDQLMEEKWTLKDGLVKDGILILNHDDERVMRVKEKAQHYTVTYGMGEGADVRGTYFRIAYEHDVPHGITFNVEHGNNIVPIHLTGVLGRQHLYPGLAAVTVAMQIGGNIVTAGKALSESREWAPGRMRILSGIRGTILIDDSYNSSPVALEEALSMLDLIDTDGRKIAILGDMMELGSFSKDAHLKGGEQVAKSADLLITSGPRAKGFAEGAQEAGMDQSLIHSYEDSTQAADEITNFIKEGDVILIKGSQSPRMERVTKVLLAHTEKASELLVRQEKEWEKR